MPDTLKFPGAARACTGQGSEYVRSYVSETAPLHPHPTLHLAIDYSLINATCTRFSLVCFPIMSTPVPCPASLMASCGARVARRQPWRSASTSQHQPTQPIVHTMILAIMMKNIRHISSPWFAPVGWGSVRYCAHLSTGICMTDRPTDPQACRAGSRSAAARLLAAYRPRLPS